MVPLSIITITGPVAGLVKASVVQVMFEAWILAWLNKVNCHEYINTHACTCLCSILINSSGECVHN